MSNLQKQLQETLEQYGVTKRTSVKPSARAGPSDGGWHDDGRGRVADDALASIKQGSLTFRATWAQLHKEIKETAEEALRIELEGPMALADLEAEASAPRIPGSQALDPAELACFRSRAAINVIPARQTTRELLHQQT